jgi:hypothetical protein
VGAKDSQMSGRASRPLGHGAATVESDAVMRPSGGRRSASSRVNVNNTVQDKRCTQAEVQLLDAETGPTPAAKRSVCKSN